MLRLLGEIDGIFGRNFRNFSAVSRRGIIIQLQLRPRRDVNLNRGSGCKIIRELKLTACICILYSRCLTEKPFDRLSYPFKSYLYFPRTKTSYKLSSNESILSARISSKKITMTSTHTCKHYNNSPRFLKKYLFDV